MIVNESCEYNIVNRNFLSQGKEILLLDPFNLAASYEI